MTSPKEFKEALWACYANIEAISIESESSRITQEMVLGKQVNEYLRIALTAIALSIDLLNLEYFRELVEDFESENYKEEFYE